MLIDEVKDMLKLSLDLTEYKEEIENEGYIEDFFGAPILLCFDKRRCKHQFSVGDGAMLACTNPQSIVLKKCPGYEAFQ